MWKKLLKLRPIALQLTRVELNNGSTTSFWYDKWSQLGVLINLTGERGCIDLGIPINTTVERAVQSYRSRRHRTSVLVQIEQEILKVRDQGLRPEEDICLWKRENDEFRPGFITSQTLNLTRSQSLKVPWFKAIWFPGATPKFSFLTWLAAHNRLATGDRILRWNPQAAAGCWLCNSGMESRDHLFFECAFSAEVLQGTIKGLVMGVTVQWSPLLQCLVNGFQDRTTTFLVRYCFQAVAYAIWYERNKRRVGELPQTSSRLTTHLDKQIRNKISSLRKKPGSKYEKTMELWFGSR